MEIMKTIYVAYVGELQDEKLANSYCEVCYTKKEAIDFCTRTVRNRLCEIKDITNVTTSELLRFMNDDEYEFNLSVSAYSSMKKQFEDKNGYSCDFNRFIEEGGPDLYTNLLSTVVCNTFDLDYFGNMTSVYTQPEAYVGFTEGEMREEDCQDGKYRGSFSYYHEGNEVPYTMQKAYVFADVEVYREPMEDDLGYYAQELSAYESMEECEEYAPFWLFNDLEHYLPLDENGYCQDISDEQKMELFHEKVYGYQLRVRNVSPKRIRFKSVEELADYYTEKLSDGSVNADNFYDFLLSMVQYEERFYDYEGKLLRSRIKLQELDGGTDYHIIPAFSYENAKDVWEQQQKLREKLYE